MTEQEWLVCANASQMLPQKTDQLLTPSRPGNADPRARFLMSHTPGEISERKLRLFGVACCRRVWHLLPDERSRTAVEVAERFADGEADERERAFARTAALSAVRRNPQAAWAAYWVASRNVVESIANLCEAAAEASARQAGESAHNFGQDEARAWDETLARDLREQADLLREVLGNPFRAVELPGNWHYWRDGLIPAIALQIYQSRDFSEMGILADALEDAGCGDQDLLQHLRLNTDHVKGCWVLDLLLEKS